MTIKVPYWNPTLNKVSILINKPAFVLREYFWSIFELINLAFHLGKKVRHKKPLHRQSSQPKCRNHHQTSHPESLDFLSQVHFIIKGPSVAMRDASEVTPWRQRRRCRRAWRWSWKLPEKQTPVITIMSRLSDKISKLKGNTWMIPSKFSIDFDAFI